MLLNDFFENIEDLIMLTFNETLGCLNVLRKLEIHEAFLHERLEEFESHGLGKTTLMELEGGANNNDRTARVIDSLTQKVLTEATLLALEHVRDRLQRAVSCTLNRAATPTVVEQCVNSFLKHPLLVVHHDLRSVQIEHALETIVAVDNSTVQIVQIRGRETATIELHHRTQIRRDHRERIKNHGFRSSLRVQERVDDLNALERAGLALSRTILDLVEKKLVLGLQIERT